MNKNQNKTLQIYGPFSTAYSLAEVNRELGVALQNLNLFDVSFVDDKIFVDRYPSSKDFKLYPEIKDMLRPKFHADVGVWSRFPHDFVSEMDADFKVAYLAWEASLLPAATVEKLNEYCDAVLAVSDFIKEAAIRSGVKVPIVVVPNAANVNKLEQAKSHSYQLPTNKNFKFLNISSGVPRKGLDVLVQAYFEEFTSNDDVTLILKTNVFDHIDASIKKLQEVYGSKSPEIIRLVGDWEEQQNLSLYSKCNAYVSPARAEGFNLPALQAMINKIPVIVTNYSGHLEFCNSENSYLVDFELSDASAVFNIPDSLWAEPSVESLKQQMRKVFEEKGSNEQNMKIEKAYKNAIENFTWEKSAEKFVEVIDLLQEYRPLRQYTMGVFSTWNTKCGIAEYSKYLYSPVRYFFKNTYFFGTKLGVKVGNDDEYVSRIWDEQQVLEIEAIKSELTDKKIDILHIQYNSGFYSLAELARLVTAAREICKKVFVTFHSLDEVIKKSGKKETLDNVKTLNDKSDILFVHRQSDKDILENHGAVKVRIIEHGTAVYKDDDKEIIRKNLGIESKHVVSSHGFILPDKGYLEIIDSIEILRKKYPDILYILASAIHPMDTSSGMYYQECAAEIEKKGLTNNVLLVSEFLSVEELMAILHASDVIVMLRKNLANESASGAIRLPLTSMRPVITNKAKIFNDIANLVYQIDNHSPEDIAKAVEYIFENPVIKDNLKHLVEENLNKISWEAISRKYLKEIL